jgi:hypothetical protein
MAGIVTALESNDDIRPFGKPIDDLAFAFVAPLRTDDDYIRHRQLSSSTRETAGRHESPGQRAGATRRTIVALNPPRDSEDGYQSARTTVSPAGQLTL